MHDDRVLALMEALGVSEAEARALLAARAAGVDLTAAAERAAADAARDRARRVDVLLRALPEEATVLDALRRVRRVVGRDAVRGVTIGDVARAARTGAALRKRGAQSADADAADAVAGVQGARPAARPAAPPAAPPAPPAGRPVGRPGVN